MTTTAPRGLRNALSWTLAALLGDACAALLILGAGAPFLLGASLGGGLTFAVAGLAADRRDGRGWLGVPLATSAFLAVLFWIPAAFAVWLIGACLGWFPPMGD